MLSVLAATAAKLTEFQPFGRGLLVFCRHIVPALAFSALEHNVITRHDSFLDFRLLIALMGPIGSIGPIGLIDRYRNPFIQALP